jgi:beta-glucosidase
VVDDVLRAKYLGHHVPAIQIPKQFGYEVEILDQYISFAGLTDENQDKLPKLVQLFI